MFQIILLPCCFQLRVIARSIGTCSVLNAKRRPQKDPGMHRRVRALTREDRTAAKDIYEEADLDDLETDFENVDQTYKQHQREREQRREHIGRIITVKKFFSGPKPPNMLTWAEKQEIKKLHAKDPEEWSVDVLCDSFPATREIITKVLKSNWIPENIDKIKRRDAVVVENWRRLAAGHLEAEPAILEHLKKFLDRREEYLKAIKDGDYSRFLPKPAKEKWSNGPMTSILESYERKLLEFDEKHRMALPEGEIRDALSQNNPETKKESEENDELNEDFVRDLGKRPVTLAYLRESIKNRVSENESPAVVKTYSLKPSLEDYSKNSQSSIDYVLRKEESPKFSSLSDNVQPVRSANPPTSVNSHQHTAPKYQYKPELEKPEFEKEPSLDDNSKNSQSSTDFVLQKQEPSKFSTLADNGDNIQPVLSANPPTNENSHQHVVPKYQYKSELEKEEFEKEEKSIKGTCFWSEENEYQILVDTDKKHPVPSKKEVIKSHLDVFGKTKVNNNSYPQKIKIPKAKRKSGLTFQVNDCFYDDDGEFLYRVPGINKSADPPREQ